MNYTISNEKLTLVVSSKGGEFQSVKDAEGQEYLWQGDAATWTDRGPNLFPYIGRMTEKSYKYQNTVYHMDIHGFLPYDEMELVEQKADSLTLRLVSSPETRKQYPFEFTLPPNCSHSLNTVCVTTSTQSPESPRINMQPSCSSISFLI